MIESQKMNLIANSYYFA